MALTDKEAALRIIEQLPDDASLDEIAEVLVPRNTERWYVADPLAHDKPSVHGSSQPVERRPVKKGLITVLEPTHPVPRISVELVNYIIEQMRRAREDRFLGLTEDDG